MLRKNSPLSFLRTLIFLAAFCFIFCRNGKAQELTYLGNLGGDFSLASGINDSGEVVGQSAVNPVSSGATPTDAFLYTPLHGIQDLGLGGSSTSFATAINNSGQVVGYSDFASPGNTGQAIIYGNGSAFQTVPGTETSGYSIANGINATGQIVGQYEPNIGSNATQAFLYNPSSGLHSIGPVGHNTNATGINNLGQVIGIDYTSNRAFIFTTGSGYQNLPLISGYTTSDAAAINNTGQIVGALGTNGSLTSAYIYSSTKGTQLLGSIGFGNWATAINNSGTVVGDYNVINPRYGSDESAFIYSEGQGIQDLNTLYSTLLVSDTGTKAGFTDIVNANAINDEGQIVGEGIYYNGSTSYQAAFLLNTEAVPEPFSWTLALLSLISVVTFTAFSAKPAGGIR